MRGNFVGPRYGAGVFAVFVFDVPMTFELAVVDALRLLLRGTPGIKNTSSKRSAG